MRLDWINLHRNDFVSKRSVLQNSAMRTRFSATDFPWRNKAALMRPTLKSNVHLEEHLFLFELFWSLSLFFFVLYSSDVSENSRVEDRVTDKPGSHSLQVGSPLCSVSEQFSFKLVTKKYQRRQTLSKKASSSTPKSCWWSNREAKAKAAKKVSWTHWHHIAVFVFPSRCT